jgi:hypothetical protein
MPSLMQLEVASVATYHLQINNKHDPDAPVIISSQLLDYGSPGGVVRPDVAAGTASGGVRQASTGVEGLQSTGPCSGREEASMGQSTEASWGLSCVPGSSFLLV